MRWLLRLTIVLGILLGVGLRIFVLTHALGTLDSDEAVTGIIARQAIADPPSFRVFYWIQAFGGTIESIVTAVPFALFGSSVLVLKVTSVLWQAVAAVLLWRVGRRLIDERAGVVAAVALWVWPAAYV